MEGKVPVRFVFEEGLYAIDLRLGKLESCVFEGVSPGLMRVPPLFFLAPPTYLTLYPSLNPVTACGLCTQRITRSPSSGSMVIGSPSFFRSTDCEEGDREVREERKGAFK